MIGRLGEAVFLQRCSVQLNLDVHAVWYKGNCNSSQVSLCVMCISICEFMCVTSDV